MEVLNLWSSNEDKIDALHLIENDWRSRGQVIDLFTKKSKTCPSDLSRQQQTFNSEIDLFVDSF